MEIKMKVRKLTLILMIIITGLSAHSAVKSANYYRFADPVTGEMTFSVFKRPVTGEGGPGTYYDNEYGNSGKTRWITPGSSDEPNPRKLHGRINGDPSFRWKARK